MATSDQEKGRNSHQDLVVCAGSSATSPGSAPIAPQNKSKSRRGARQSGPPKTRPNAKMAKERVSMARAKAKRVCTRLMMIQVGSTKSNTPRPNGPNMNHRYPKQQQVWLETKPMPLVTPMKMQTLVCSLFGIATLWIFNLLNRIGMMTCVVVAVTAMTIVQIACVVFCWRDVQL